MRPLLGGKGANLAEMTRIGLPVPDGFTITTEACVAYLREDGRPPGLDEQVAEHLATLEKRSGKRLGDRSDPLLVSVRSGAVISMPGMMDTILNLGMNDESVLGLAEAGGGERFAYDSYRRFIQMFGDVVAGVDAHLFENALQRLKLASGAAADVDLDAGQLEQLVGEFRAIYEAETGEPFPQDPQVQLSRSIEAVFQSWNTPRARTYRREYHIADDLGTAVNVVQMVFGNMGDDSATGVAFTRNPSTGEPELYGEYLRNAQGEDVVAGIRTPQPLAEMESELPESFRQLADTMHLLERHYREMQDIEFTIERGTLYLLQTRTGKRTAAAALKVARDLVDEGLISREEALERIDPDQLDQLLHPTIDPSAERDVIAHGLNASPGAAVGAVVFDADTAEARGKDGQDVILVRVETTPDDIHGVVAAQGVLTARGGMTSHAAVVARGLGKPCVAGAEEIDVDAEAAAVPGGRRRGARGRCDHDRRRAGRGDARRDAAGAAAGQRGLPHDHRLGRRGAAAARARQRRHAGRRRQGARAGRRGHRPLPHRAHVLRRRAAAGGAAHDPGVRRGQPAGGAGRAAALPAERLRGHLARRWPGCR